MGYRQKKIEERPESSSVSQKTALRHPITLISCRRRHNSFYPWFFWNNVSKCCQFVSGKTGETQSPLILSLVYYSEVKKIQRITLLQLRVICYKARKRMSWLFRRLVSLRCTMLNFCFLVLQGRIPISLRFMWGDISLNLYLRICESIRLLDIC